MKKLIAVMMVMLSLNVWAFQLGQNQYNPEQGRWLEQARQTNELARIADQLNSTYSR